MVVWVWGFLGGSLARGDNGGWLAAARSAGARAFWCHGPHHSRARPTTALLYIMLRLSFKGSRARSRELLASCFKKTTWAAVFLLISACIAGGLVAAKPTTRRFRIFDQQAVGAVGATAPSRQKLSGAPVFSSASLATADSPAGLDLQRGLHRPQKQMGLALALMKGA